MMPGTNNTMLAALVVAALATSGCLGLAQGESPAPDATRTTTSFEPVTALAVPSGPVPVEHPVSIDLVIPFYVYYSTVASEHCASEVVKVDGPVISVDVTATWDMLYPQTLELTVYNGSRIKADPHTGYPTGDTIAQQEGPSPLTLDADVEAGDTVRLQVCQWENLVVAQDFDVHIEGSVLYLDPALEAT